MILVLQIALGVFLADWGTAITSNLLLKFAKRRFLAKKAAAQAAARPTLEQMKAEHDAIVAREASSS